MNQEQKKAFWVWLVVIVLSGAAIIYHYHKLHNIEGTGKQQVILYDHLPAGFTTAPIMAGKLPAQFPKEVLLFPQATFVKGNITQPGTNDSIQITVIYSLSNTLKQIFDTYQTGLTKIGWLMTTSNLQSNMAYERFIKNGDQLNLIATPVATSTQLQLVYIPSPSKDLPK